MARLKREIEEVRRHRKLHRTRRRRNLLPTVALVGYTNAGKSTLFEALTGSKTRVSSQVFSTLDPIVRRVRLDDGMTILLSDTVGFFRKLPTELVAAFRATLEEVADADLIVQVVDVSYPDWDDRAAVVDSVLREVGCEGRPRLLVLNKVDLADRPVPVAKGIPVSALRGEGMGNLKAEIRSALRGATPEPASP
jgi:GTP-binding protein HflX